MNWQPIATALTDTPVLIGRKGWLPVIAVSKLAGGSRYWGECLGGEFYGTKPPFEPTHWMLLEEPPTEP